MNQKIFWNDCELGKKILQCICSTKENLDADTSESKDLTDEDHRKKGLLEPGEQNT